MIEYRHSIDDDKWNYLELLDNGDVIATARWIAHDNVAELHNEVVISSHNALKKIKTCFAVVRAIMSTQGIDRVVVLSDRCDDKMRKFWKMMGFEFFTQCHGVECAVMEV